MNLLDPAHLKIKYFMRVCLQLSRTIKLEYISAIKFMELLSKVTF